MQNPIANLFLALQSAIANLQDPSGNPYFRIVDQDLGQLEQERPPVSWPVVLIDMDSLHFKPIGQNAQTGEGTIILRLGFPPYSSASSLTPQEYKELALYYYDLEQILYQALHGIPPDTWQLQPSFTPTEAWADYFGAMMRQSVKTERRNDTLRVRIITYTIGLEDYTATKQQQYAPAIPNIMPTFTFPIP